jgi:hypothetical protein
MELMERTSTDERFDDLNAKVDRGFARIDTAIHSQRVETRTELAALRSEMRRGFERVDGRFERGDERFERMIERIDERFDALHRLLVQFCGVLLTALIGLFATQL